MGNTISMNGMTGYYNSFIQSVTRKSTSRASTGSVDNAAETKTDFKTTIASKVEVDFADEVQEAGQAEAVSTKDMTLEEYKNYIHDKISSFMWHADNMGDSCSINISDEGFKAMQNDPEYEKWVLDDLKTAFATPMPGWTRSIGGTKYQVVHYGASKEECRSTSWWTGYQGGVGDKVWEAQSKGGFWTKRGDQTKIQDRVNQKTAEKKELEKKWLQKSVDKRQAYTDFLNGKTLLKTDGLSGVNDFFSMPTDPKVAGILSAYEAGTFVSGGM